jgi:hypothetical protein
MRVLVLRAILMATLACLTLVPAVSAAPAPRSVEVITVPMTLDCSSAPTNNQAVAFMTANHLCGYGTGVASPGSGITPQNTVYGSCGTLSVYTFNLGSGNMMWKGEITSSAGPFVAAGYSGSWLNNTRGNGGGVGRSFIGLTSDWLDIFTIYTRSGTVYSVISSAWDRLWWGGLCTAAGSPWSYANVK